MAGSGEETAAAGGDDPCLAMLRDSDRDRYLACLLSPPHKRAALAALYAFNAELARIRDLVHEPLPGEIRLQWWRDVLEGDPRGEGAGHPLAAALLRTIARHDLPRRPFVGMIEARIFDLYDDPFEDRNALEGYAGETAAALIQLAAIVLSPEEAAKAAEAAGHAGVAQAMAGLLLMLPRHYRRGQVPIPLDMLAAAGLDRDTFLEGKDKTRIGAAIDIFASHALNHLDKARKLAIPAPAFAAFLPVALAAPVIAAARKAGPALLSRDIQPSLPRRHWLLAKAALTGRF